MSADVSGTFSSWSSTASSNSPSGTTNISTNLDDNLRAIQAVVAAWRDSLQYGNMVVGSVSGTNTITGTVTSGPTALASGMTFRFIPANSNTGAVTLEITSGSSLGAKNIFLNGVALVGYELRKNCPVEVTYDGTQFNVISGAHGGDGISIGTIRSLGGSTVPNSHLACDGSAVSRTTYADLFAVIGTGYGVGDGVTTFNVPSLAGCVLVGSGTATRTEDVTASSSNGFTVASNDRKWITGMAVILSNLASFTTSASAGPTYYIYRASATNVRLCSTLAIAQNATTGSMETISGTGTCTLTYTGTARTLGEVGGEEAHAESSTEQLAHVHAFTVFDSANNGTYPKESSNDAGSSTASGNPVQSTGGNAAMNIMPLFGVGKYVIKY